MTTRTRPAPAFDLDSLFALRIRAIIRPDMGRAMRALDDMDSLGLDLLTVDPARATRPADRPAIQ